MGIRASFFRTKLVLVLLLVLAGRAAAKPAQELTLEEALRLARQNNLDLKIMHEVLAKSHVGIEQARVALMPTLSAQGRYTHNYREVTLDVSQVQLQSLQTRLQNDTIADIYAQLGQPPSARVFAGRRALAFYAAQLPPQNTDPIVIQKLEQLDGSLNLSVPLLVPWAYAALRGAQQTFTAASANFSVTQTALLFTIAQAFYTAAGADELVTARRNAIEIAQQTAQSAQKRLNAGVVNRIEVTRAQLAQLQAEQAAREADAAQRRAYRALATLIGMNSPFRVVPPTMAAAPESALEELLGSAPLSRPELTVYQANVAAADSQLASARWHWAPTLSGFGFLRGFNYASFSGDPYAWALGLQLDWTLYDGGLRDSQLHQATAERRENALRLRQLRTTIHDEILDQYESLQLKRVAVETAQMSLALAQQTLDVARGQYASGTGLQLDILQAQDGLVVAAVTLAQAHFDYGLVRLRLLRAAGQFPDR